MFPLFPVLAPVTTPAVLYPTSDVAVNNWETYLGGSTNLYQMLDEVTRNDSDYVRCLDGSSGTEILKLGFPTPAGTPVEATLRYTHWMDDGFSGGVGRISVRESGAEIVGADISYTTGGAWDPSTGYNELSIPVGSVSNWANIEVWILADDSVGDGLSGITEQRCSMVQIAYTY